VVDGVCNIGWQLRAMCGDVTSTRCFVATDLVIENDRLFDVGCTSLPSLPSIPIPLLLSCTLIYLEMMSNKRRVAQFFNLARLKMPCENLFQAIL